MRISYSERARISEKLRERADDPWMELGDICEDIGCDVRRGEEAAVFRRLADLIDPDNIPDNADGNAHGLSGSCDRDALLKLADEMDRVGYNDWLYSGEWEPEEIARRIHEALGVES